MDNIRVKKESLFDWRSTLTEETNCDCEGCGQDPCIKCGDDCHNLNEEVQGGINVENYADGVQFNEIETIDIIKPKALDPSNWRSELTQVNEKYKFIGPGKGKKTSEKDMSKNKGEKINIDYSRIQASKSADKETVSASNEIEGDLVDEGLLKGAIGGAKLIAKIAPQVTKGVIKGGKALAKKGAGDVSKFVKSQKVANRAINIEKIRANKPVLVKPVNVKWNPTVPSKIKPRVSTISSKQISGSAGTQYKKPIGANPTAKTQHKEPIGPKLTKNQKIKLTGKAQKIIAQIHGKTPGAKQSARMEKGYNKNLEITADKIIKDIKATPIPKEKAIVKSPAGSLAKTTDKGSAIVKNSGGKLTKEVKPNERKLSAVDKLNRAKSGTQGKGTTYTSKGVRQLPGSKVNPAPASTPKKDEGGKAIQRVLGGAGGAAGYKLATGGKEKKESFSNWRSEINL